MASKPETTFVVGVHKHLPRTLHREKMNNPYRGGTADQWYSGSTGDLWIEYKFLPRTPQRGVVRPDVSLLQKKWLRGRYEEGRNVCVIVGCPAGGVILRDLEWEDGLPCTEFGARIQSRADLANWIETQTVR